VSIIPPFSAVKSLFVLKHSEANWNIHLAKKCRKKKQTLSKTDHQKNKLQEESPEKYIK